MMVEFNVNQMVVVVIKFLINERYQRRLIQIFTRAVPRALEECGNALLAGKF